MDKSSRYPSVLYHYTITNKYIIFISLTNQIVTNGGDILIGIASDEEYRAKRIPGYVCCSFMGAFMKVSISGTILWKMRTVPNNGGVASAYSGAGIWGSAPAIVRILSTI